MSYIILDTNILLLDSNNVLNIEGVAVIPATVLAELDSKKSGFDEINFQARAFARLIESATSLGMTRENDMVVTKLELQDKEIHIVSLNNYVADPLAYGGNDARIIEVAAAYTKLYDNAVLMTNDMLMKFQASAAGLEVTSLKMVDDKEVEFTKELLVTEQETFRTLHNADIMKVDPDYQVGTYSYKFTCDTTNQMKLATIQNGFITVLGKETESQLRLQEAAPMNGEQLLMSKAIQDTLIDIVVVEAKSGSGKTVSAISNAMRLMKVNKDKYQSITYIRNSVDDIGNRDEEVGFLSGNDEKLAVYLHPLEDTLDFMARKRVNTKGMKVEDIEEKVAEGIAKLKVEYNIQGMIAMGLRGRTLHNSIVIIDEAQNIGTSTMQKIITRVGKNSKLIVIGSQKQIDSCYLNSHNNGLAVLMDECANRNLDTNIGLFAINLHKVLRSPMSEFGEDLFSK